MIVKTEKDIIQSYFEDSSGLIGGYADKVVLPESIDDVIMAIKEANDNRIPVTVSGAGTGVTAARVPFGGIVLATDKLDKILKIHERSGSDNTICVECGARLEKIAKAVEAHKLMYPPDPTEQNAFIGGSISTNASGARTFKYGPTRNYVKALTVVLADGEVLEMARGNNFADENGVMKFRTRSGKEIKLKVPGYQMPRVKNAAGYFAKPKMDLIDLFIGHEGTLGVIVDCELGLIEAVPDSFDCCVFFREDASALDFVNEVKVISSKSREGSFSDAIDAMSIEYLDNNSLKILSKKYTNMPGGAECAIFFEQAIKDNENLILEKWKSLFDKYPLIEDIWFAQTRPDKEKFKTIRYDLPEMINEMVKNNKKPKVGTDIAVPHKNLNEMFLIYKSIFKKQDIPYAIFGHIGDSHLHANILPSTDADLQSARALYTELVKKAIQLGGTVSAEHGIGKLKHKYLEMMYSKNSIMQMVQLKKTLDPNCILGLDNIFPKEYLLS